MITNFLSLDLELNQPSDKIIQIGAVAGNIFTGDIVDQLSILVKIDEKLCIDASICDIPKLTGITDAMLQKDGISLLAAYEQLANFRVKNNCHRTPMTWGGGDIPALKSQLKDSGLNFSEGFGVNKHLPMFCFGRRWIDIKSLYQVYMLMNGNTMQAGLRKAINKMGLTFYGRAHNAQYDAYNTFKVAHLLASKLINKNNKEK